MASRGISAGEACAGADLAGKRVYALTIDAPTKCADERDAESARAS
jgi:hypothetical protein